MLNIKNIATLSQINKVILNVDKQLIVGDLKAYNKIVDSSTMDDLSYEKFFELLGNNIRCYSIHELNSFISECYNNLNPDYTLDSSIISKLNFIKPY
jgi:hypothetical protein